MAQSVEHVIGNDEVISSILITSSKTHLFWGAFFAFDLSTVEKRYLLTEILFIQIPLAIKQKSYNLLSNTIKPVGAKSPTGLYINIEFYFKLRYVLYLGNFKHYLSMLSFGYFSFAKEKWHASLRIPRIPRVPRVPASLASYYSFFHASGTVRFFLNHEVSLSLSVLAEQRTLTSPPMLTITIFQFIDVNLPFS